MQAATAMDTLHTAQLVSRLEMRIAAKALVHSSPIQKAANASFARKVTTSSHPAVSYGGSVSGHKNKMKVTDPKARVAYTIA